MAVAALVALTAGTAAPARAQHAMALGHGFAGPPQPRALHVRLALADAAAVATVDEVGLGRIRVREAEALFGAVAPAFELKRAPSSPPPLEAGDRALLLLRGARSPYLLVDEPHETLVLADAAAEARWREAVLALRTARDEPRALAALYLRWLEASTSGLRSAALAGLRDRTAPFQPLAAEELERLVELAGSAEAADAARSAAATIASQHPGGRRALLEQLPGEALGADPEVLLIALRAGALARDPALGPAVLRGLRHPRAEIRRAALQFGGLARSDPALRAQLETMAAGDSDTELRQLAQRVAEATRGGPQAHPPTTH